MVSSTSMFLKILKERFILNTKDKNGDVLKMEYEKYIYEWENELLDAAEYERTEKYTFACLKRVRHKLAVTLHNDEECTKELLQEILLHLNAIHSNFSYIENKYDNYSTE